MMPLSGSSNYLAFDFACPWCGTISETAAEFRFGSMDETRYQVGDALRWNSRRLHWPRERPKDGNYDGRAYVQCPNCQGIFTLVIPVRCDALGTPEVDPTHDDPDVDFAHGELIFIFRPGPFRWGEALISDGTQRTTLEPSYVLEDPLLALISAMVAAIQTGEGRCSWWWEPVESRWILRRDGEQLRISILRFPDLHYHERDEFGRLDFAATCALWKFAARLRLVVQRIVSDTLYREYGVMDYEHISEFLRLCELLDEHASRRDDSNRLRGSVKRGKDRQDEPKPGSGRGTA